VHLTVASWNVLAGAYLGSGDYSHVPADVLGPSRVHAVTELIAERDEVDIWALQEVEPALIEVITRHPSLGLWTRIWTPKPSQPDGLALLLRPPLAPLHEAIVEFDDGSDGVAQVITLEHPDLRRRYRLGNVHLRYDGEDAIPHAGVQQLRQVIGHLPGMTVLLGDFNGRPGGRVRRYLDYHRFQLTDGATPTAWVNQAPAALDLIATSGIDAYPLATDFQVEGIPNAQCPSDHIPVIARLEF
jgi:endonuclease/exonuclease/phosphatase family metal-dependent hydrolase